MKKSKWVLGAAALLALSVAVAGCGGDKKADDKKAGGVNGELMVYNRFNNSAESTEKKTMGEVIENGQFIVGYRVQNAK